MSRPPFSVLAQRRVSNLLCLATGVLIVAFVFAAEAPLVRAEDEVEPPGYRETIVDALAEYEAENYLEARSLFAKAHGMLPNARTLRALGVVSFELKRYSESIGFLEQALASDDKRLDGKMLADTERLLERAWAFVAQIKVTVHPSDARVAIDGSEARLVPDRLLLDVGNHQLEFQSPGFQPVRRSLAVVGAERTEWSISLHEDDAAPLKLAAAESAPARHRFRKAVGGTVIGLGVVSFALAGVFMDQRREAGAALRAVPESTFSPLKLSEWEDSRTKPYVFAALGSAAVTTGILGLLLSASRESIPWWAPMLAGIGGAGLVAWGAADLAQGAPCALPPRFQGRCTLSLQQRDRGGIVLLSAAPLVAAPLTQLIRRALAPSLSNSSVAFDFHMNPLQRAVVVDARSPSGKRFRPGSTGRP